MSWFKKPSKQPEGLISVLRDVNAEYGDRGDAAMDLSDFDEPEVRVALAEVATNPATNPRLADTAADSLGEIWCRTGAFDREVYGKLTGAARSVATAWIKECHPEWLEEPK